MVDDTREGYTYSNHAHIMNCFGPMRMIELLPSGGRSRPLCQDFSGA